MKHFTSCLWLLLFVSAPGGCSGCGKDGSEDASEDADAGDEVQDPLLDPSGDEAVEITDPAEEDAMDEDAPLPPPLDRALLIDLDLMHHSAWLDLKSACDSAGITLEYRRFFPHVSDADIAGEEAYSFIMVAAGSAPGMAASRLSTDEIERMAAFVEGGGLLLLMPQPTRLDSYYGENDWFVLNRVLEELGSGMRVERGSLLGPLFLGSPDPPHLDTGIGYATLLEFDMGYAWALPNEETGLAEILDGPLPAGRATVLRTRGSDLAVILHAHWGSNLWIRTEGATIGDQIRSIIDDRPMAAVERIGNGILAVVPRFLVTLGGAGGQVSEHPANSTATILRNAVFLEWLMAYLGRLFTGEEELAPTDPSGGDDELFWVSAPSIPPAGEGEVIPVAYQPSSRPVAPVPPGGTLFEEFLDAPADTPPPAVPIFSSAKGKIGYGAMPWDDAAAGTVLSEAAAMGLDALVGGFTPERLVTGELADEDAAAMREAMARLADLAGSAGVFWLVGSYYTGHVYNSNPSIFPRSVGAQRQTYDAPPLLYEPLWDDYLIPAAGEVAATAAAHPGIGGILVDMEMYGTVLTYTDAQAFDDTTYDVYLETVTDPAILALLEAQVAETRLDVLIEQGLLADYFEVLTQAAAAIGARYREAVSALSPDFTVALYFPGIPTCWQYRGLIQGLGTERSPVVILTYDPFSHPYRANMTAGDAWAVHLGGPIVSHFPPDALTAVLGNCGDFTDGFWYFSHDEISENASQELVFGTRSEYRDAVTLAGEDL
jgi:hypothetical protein